MIEISAENLLVNYFTFRSEKEISFKQMKNLRKFIEKEFDNEIYVNITGESVYQAVRRNESFFDLTDIKVTVTDPEKTFFNERIIKEQFNWRFPVVMEKKYVELIKLFNNNIK